MGWRSLRRYAANLHRNPQESQEGAARLEQVKKHVATLPEKRREAVLAYIATWERHYADLEKEHAKTHVKAS
jgi:hypothetical protein